MRRGALSIAFLLSPSCGTSEDLCRLPESGPYRVQWLTTPTDCPFLDQPGHVEVLVDDVSSCFFWDDDACSLVVLANQPSCGYTFASGFAAVEAEGLTQIAPNRFRGPGTARVDDRAWTDSFPTGRRCAEGGTLELVLDRAYAPAPPTATPPVDFCDPEASDCPPKQGEACIASCEDGLLCQYPAGEPHDGTGICGPSPLAGAACVDNVDPEEPFSCARRLAYCDAQRMCRPHPAHGEPCEIDFETCRTEPCISDAQLATCFDGYCAPQPTGPSICRPYKQRGEPCALSPYDNRIECDYDGLVCTCTETDCTSGICLEERFSGERCDEPDVVCYEGLRCLQGVCGREQAAP